MGGTVNVRLAGKRHKFFKLGSRVDYYLIASTRRSRTTIKKRNLRHRCPRRDIVSNHVERSGFLPPWWREEDRNRSIACLPTCQDG
ncbi:hypothetical protein ATANTOWER_017293 [Ataeniobius toweri]|uniref:Uncharacterized protein n=1 Tax=Ataeniobius toweri TaxID=208326 RepID=A0ABU7AVL3_9TELE|nr:hypothetical protein [Ataeniobius toweri]